MQSQATLDVLARIVNSLQELGASVSVAESSTGGLISAALLSIPGAGTFFKGGGVLYTLESRVSWGGWSTADLRAYRGPTDAVVTGLAESVGKQLGATYSVGESGISGPNDLGRRLVAGYTVIAVTRPNGRAFTRAIRTGRKDRWENMNIFAHEALTLLAETLESDIEDLKKAAKL